MRAQPTNDRPQLSRLALAVAAAWMSTLAVDVAGAQGAPLPVGPNVAHGQASIVTQGNRMTVTNSNNAILNWQSFSVGAGNAVRFNQPRADSRVLNRVVGQDPSQILGSLSSNGQVWLLNPNGVLFGREARIDVAGLVASTLSARDADFIGGRQRFATEAGAPIGAAVVNQGELRTALGGRLALVAGDGGVRNVGLIDAPGGQVVLAAGHSVDFVDTGAPHIALRVSAPRGEVVNLGQLVAAGGRIDVQAAIVNQQGLVRADALSSGAGGEVLLLASESVNLAAGSRTSADGAQGGRVVADATHGVAMVEGRVSADASTGSGGQVQLLGRHVGLSGRADMSASGSAGGGQVLVGGGMRGQDAAVINARAAYVGPDVRVAADATARGDGGRVIVYSDGPTRAYGAFSARGGAGGGNGGLIETSGRWLDARPRGADAGAPAGRPGEWLLDPYDVTITDNPNVPLQNVTLTFEATASPAYVFAPLLRAALTAGTSVTVATNAPGSTAGSEPGDIFMQGIDLTVSPVAPVSFTLSAARNIQLNGSRIVSTHGGAPMTVRLSAAGSGNVGAVSLLNSTIETAGGDLDIGGSARSKAAFDNALYGMNFTAAMGYNPPLGTTTRVRNGIDIAGSALDAGAGTIALRGASIADATAAVGVRIASLNGVPSALTASTIDIAGWAQSPFSSPTAADAVGVSIGLSDGTGSATSNLDASRAISMVGTAIGSSPLVDANTALGVVLNSGARIALNGAGAVDQLLISGTAASRHLQVGNLANAATLLRTTTGNPSLLTVSGGATATLRGLIDTPEPGDLSISFDGGSTVSPIVDAAGASALVIAGASTLRGDSSVLFEDTVLRLPQGGAVSVTSQDRISFSASSLIGVPASLTLQSAGRMSVRDDSSIDFASTPISIRTPEFSLTDATIASGARIDVATDALSFGGGGGASIRSLAAGDAIVVSGFGAAGVQSLNNNVGSAALDAPNGRWLIYAANPGSGFNASCGCFFDFDDLKYGFRQYGTPFANRQVVAGSIVTPLPGSGLLFSAVPAALTLGGTPSKTYDGSVQGSIAGNALSVTAGLFAGDEARFASTVSGRFASANAGVSDFNPDAQSVSFVDALGQPVFGYAGPGGVQGNIDRAQLTVLGGTAASRVYDGGTGATITSVGFAGLVGSEQLIASATGAFGDPNAGTGKTVFGNVTALADGANGGLASNYRLAGSTAFTTQADIARAPLTSITATAADKVYDGSDVATITGVTFGGLIGNEQLVASATGTFADANAGVGKTVSGSVDALAGGANGGLTSNYTLAGASFTTAASIFRAPLTVAGATAGGKVYDGNRNATITAVTLGGLVGSERLGFAAGGLFADADAGTGKAVSGNVTGLSDGGSGGLASNYQLVGSTQFTTRADISRAPLTVLGATAADKVYDASVGAAIAGVTLGGLVGSEQLVISASGAFADADAGTGKTVSGSVSALADGANGGRASNYTLAGTGFATTATISRAPLTVFSATANDKIYNTTTDATIASVSFSGLVGSEQLQVSAGGAFADPNAGTGKAVAGSVTALGNGANGGRAANYSLASPGFSTRASILPATLTYVADPSLWVLPATMPGLSGSVTGLLGQQTLQQATIGTLQFATSGQASLLPGSYAVQGGGLTAPNYVFVQHPDNATALAVLPPVALASQPTTGLNAALEKVTLPPMATEPGRGRAVDVAQWLNIGAPAAATAFGAVPVGTLSRDSLVSLLAAREQYKQRLFADAVDQLTRDPALADAAECKTTEQAESGVCLVTDALKREIVTKAATTVAAAPSAPQPTAAPPAQQPAAPLPGEAAVPAVVLPSKQPVKTAALPQIERKVAVLIGIDDYDDKRIPRLSNARADARTLAGLLGSRLGYETVVLDNAPKATILRTLNALATTLKPNDSVVIYYAGHGQVVDATGLGYWQPADADAMRPQTWLSNADIGKAMSLLDASQIALVSDSCYSGSLVSQDRIRPLGGNVDAATLLSRRAAVVMASGGNEPVFDSGKNGHSPFAFSLMQAIEQVPAWQPGGNVFERVRFAVARELPQRPKYGAALTGRHETGSDYLFERRELAGQ